MMRLADVDPDIVFADVSLPRKSGYEICRELKQRPRHKHVRVILTAGLLETFDDAQAAEVRCDGILKKPFEASVMMETLKPLVEGARKDRGEFSPSFAADGIVPVRVVTDPADLAPALSEVDVERVRAAVTLALDAALPAMIDKITEQVLVALGH
jgi:CheY-like chemotaxis protein